MTPPDATSPARLAVFLSGSGRTLVNLADRIDAGELNARIELVVASRPCPGAERAKERGFDTRIEPGDLAPDDVERLLASAGADFGVLAGYLRLLGVPPSWRGRIVNIHPALLPSFGGTGMYGLRVHRAVLDAGCKVSGCTVHLCDDRYDTGPIIAQRCCAVREDDTPETLAARVFEIEKELYPEAIARLIEGRVRIDAGRASILPASSGAGELS